MPKQNRGPYILAAGAAAQLLTGIPAAWGVFQQPVMQGYGFSRGQAMLAFAVLVAAYGVGCAVGGLLQDARGPRFAGLWGTVLLAGGFFAAALVPPANAALFLVIYSVPAGLGSAFLAPAVLACAQKWYQDKKGWATGVAGVAMGLSGAFRLAAGPAGSYPGTLTHARTSAPAVSSTTMLPVVIIRAATASAARWTSRERVNCTPTAPLSAWVCSGVSRSFPCALTRQVRVSPSPVPERAASKAASSPAAPLPSPSTYPIRCSASGAAGERTGTGQQEIPSAETSCSTSRKNGASAFRFW